MTTFFHRFCSERCLSAFSITSDDLHLEVTPISSSTIPGLCCGDWANWIKGIRISQGSSGCFGTNLTLSRSRAVHSRLIRFPVLQPAPSPDRPSGFLVRSRFWVKAARLVESQAGRVGNGPCCCCCCCL